MGQYYRAYLKRDGKRPLCYATQINPEDKSELMDWEREQIEQRGWYWEGAKLMEHSYVGNYFVEGVMENLMKAPAIVAWVGDYASVMDDKNPWKVKGRVVRYKKPKKEHLLDGLFIVNHTKKQYINFDEYYKKERTREIWEGKEYFRCYHPVPLLTAVGNGGGGGGYYGSNKKLIGAWAYDLLSIDKNAPDGFEKILPHFKESH